MKFFETSKYHFFKKSTYISLRWIGIIGQLISVNFVYFFLNFDFNFVLMLCEKNKSLKKLIIDTTDATIEDGGSGAFYIYLKNKNKFK